MFLDPIDEEEVATRLLSDVDPNQSWTTSEGAAALLDRGWKPLLDL